MLDASATAIYGSAAANGVILITTKGKADGRRCLPPNTEEVVIQRKHQNILRSWMQRFITATGTPVKRQLFFILPMPLLMEQLLRERCPAHPGAN